MSRQRCLLDVHCHSLQHINTIDGSVSSPPCAPGTAHRACHGDDTCYAASSQQRSHWRRAAAAARARRSLNSRCQCSAAQRRGTRGCQRRTAEREACGWRTCTGGAGNATRDRSQAGRRRGGCGGEPQRRAQASLAGSVVLREGLLAGECKNLIFCSSCCCGHTCPWLALSTPLAPRTFHYLRPLPARSC